MAHMTSRMIRRTIRFAVLFVVLFFVVNFNWSHAALVYMSSRDTCPQKPILRARKDVAHLFGQAYSRPWWLCLKKSRLGLDVSHGSTRFAPFFPAVIIVGKKGTRRDVMAHEYAHAELARRTSALARTYLFPVWFDEGLAMQLDHRSPYTGKALRRYLARNDLTKPRLGDIAWAGQFFRPGEQGRLHYALARCVVKKWLQTQAGGRPLKLLRQTGWIKGFPYRDFYPFEALCLGNRPADVSGNGS